jgi:hypothetical protein
MPVNRKLRSRETRRSILDAKTVPKACKIGLSPPNWPLPVNNTVKKRKNCLYRRYQQRMKPNTSIGYPNGYQKDWKLNGLRGFSSRDKDRTVPKKRNRDADRWVRECLERLKTKNKPQRQVKVNSPRNNCRCRKRGWCEEQDPSNDRRNNRLKARVVLSMQW